MTIRAVASNLASALAIGKTQAPPLIAYNWPAFDVAFPVSFQIYSSQRWMDALMALEDRREPIFDLVGKYWFLKENKVSRDQCGHSPNDSSFSKCLGIPRSTLLGSLDKGGLTVSQQEALAKKCGFSLDWPEWNDAIADRRTKRENRRDTFEAFRARYLGHHGLERVDTVRVPQQSAAPVECKWSAEHLQLLVQTVEHLDEAAQDGRLANYEHLKSECDRLRSEFVGNNAARRVCELLDRYAQALADAFEKLDVYRLGHAGIALRAAANGAREILSDASNAEIAGLLTSHELFVRQDPKWNKYVETASRANFDATLFEKHAKLGEHVTKLLKGFSPIVDKEIPRILTELRHDIANVILQASIQCYGY